MLIRLNKNRAQSITEYAVLMGIIVLAIVLTQVYMKRSIQGKFKSTADDIGEQFTTGQTYTMQTVQQGARRELSGLGTRTQEQLKESWSDSTIQTSTEAGVPPTVAAGLAVKLTNYAGHEITQKDYVDSTTRNPDTAAVGAHTSFSSGKLQDKNPFTEATGSGTE